MNKTIPKKRRARTKTGHYKADNPDTPDVNEAWEIVEAKDAEYEEVKNAAPVPEEKPVIKSEPDIVWFESRQEEPAMLPVAGISPIRNFSTNRLEYKVKGDDVSRFSQNHFVVSGRVVRK